MKITLALLCCIVLLLSPPLAASAADITCWFPPSWKSKPEQANASLIEQNAASSEELASQAKGLLKVVSYFKVQETSGVMPSRPLPPPPGSAPEERRFLQAPGRPEGSVEADRSDFEEF
jgi:hypothetical protein